MWHFVSKAALEFMEDLGEVDDPPVIDLACFGTDHAGLIDPGLRPVELSYALHFFFDDVLDPQ